MVTIAAHATSARVSEDMLAAMIACLEQHERDDSEPCDSCMALLELEAALEAEERMS